MLKLTAAVFSEYKFLKVKENSLRGSFSERKTKINIRNKNQINFTRLIRSAIIIENKTKNKNKERKGRLIKGNERFKLIDVNQDG